MTKDQYLRELRMELQGRIDADRIASELEFYEEYIRVQGLESSEEEVCEKLGSPRLIAKSIAASLEGAEDTQPESEAREEEPRSSGRSFRIPLWVFIALGLLILLVVLGLIFTIVWQLLPILLPIFIVVLILKILIDKRYNPKE